MLFTAFVPGGCTVLILLAMLVGGRIRTSRGVTTDLLELAILYFAGSVFLGGAIGFGIPYMRGFLRASVVSVIAVAPLVIGSGLSMDEGHWASSGPRVTEKKGPEQLLWASQRV